MRFRCSTIRRCRARDFSPMPERCRTISSERYVLKPLFSFAGAGVNVAPSRADVAAIPAEQRGAWCLQEKIEYAPVLAAADGGRVKSNCASSIFVPTMRRSSRSRRISADFRAVR